MATPFSQGEREIIDQKLRQGAKECLERWGVRKTTVDELVARAGISKGSFYNFYPGKEVLFFKVLEEYQENLIKDFLTNLKKQPEANLADALYQLYQDVKESFLITIMQNNELDYLIRKVPREIIAEHHSFDSLLAEQIFSHFPLKPTIDQKVVLTALRAIFLSLIHVEAVGEAHYDEALKLLIKGLVSQISKEG